MTLDVYEAVAARIERVLDAAGLDVTRYDAPWALATPTRALRAVGGEVFRRQLPAKLAYFRGAGLEVILMPNGISIYGPLAIAVRAQGLLTEGLAFGEALQTIDADAQEIEKRLKELRTSLRADASGRQLHGSREDLVGVGRALLLQDLPDADWQILYRLSLQLSRELCGQNPFLEEVEASEMSAPAPLRAATG